jgi:pimeloyl-ACP methyl ester carboxylesterase
MRSTESGSRLAVRSAKPCPELAERPPATGDLSEPAQRAGVRAKELLSVDDGAVRVHVHHWPGVRPELPVVLLHGLFDTGAGWEQLAADTDRELYALDLPGFGGSTLPAQATLDSYAERIRSTLRRLGVDRYVLVGHSLGGGIAVELAQVDADRVHTLVLMAPVGFGRIPVARAFAAPVIRDVAAHCVPMAMLSAPIVSLVYTYLVAGGMAPDGELVRRLRASAWQLGRGAKAATIAIAAAGERPFARIAYDGPVFVLWGGRDQLVSPSHADRLGRLLPQAEVAVWPRMAHHPQAERPDTLLRYLMRAWSDAPGGLPAIVDDELAGDDRAPLSADGPAHEQHPFRDFLWTAQRAVRPQPDSAEVVMRELAG